MPKNQKFIASENFSTLNFHLKILRFTLPGEFEWQFRSCFMNGNVLYCLLCVDCNANILFYGEV